MSTQYRINILYDLLTCGSQSTTVLTATQQRIRELLVPADAVGDKRTLLCRCICWQAVNSRFRDEILAIDGLNTYRKPQRTPDVPASADNVTGTQQPPDCSTVYPSLLPAAAYKELEPLLPVDVAARITTPLWEDMAGAGALAMLREV